MRGSWLRVGIPALVVVALVIGGIAATPADRNLSKTDDIDWTEIKKASKNLSEKEMFENYQQASREAEEQHRKAIEYANRVVVDSVKRFKENSDATISSCYYSDSTVDGSYSSYGGSGVGYSTAWTKNNELHVFARAWLAGSYWAHGRNWDRFTYNCADGWNKVSINYFLRGRVFGSIAGVGTTTSTIKIRLRVYDHTWNQEIENKEIFSYTGSGIYNKYFEENKSGYAYVYLRNGHTYTVELLADVTSEGYGQAAGMSDFESQEFDGDWRMVKWNYDEITPL